MTPHYKKHSHMRVLPFFPLKQPITDKPVRQAQTPIHKLEVSPV